MKTFREQYDKLVKAYLKNKVNPYSGCACFIGNLLNGAEGWVGLPGRISKIRERYAQQQPILRMSYFDHEEDAVQCIAKESDNTYTKEEIVELEHEFMKRLPNYPHPYTEDQLYNAFEAALLMLKEIHESKGEVIEDYAFKKRELAIAK